MNNISKFTIFALTAIMLFLYGCNAPREHLNGFNKYYETGNYGGAAVFAEEKVKKRHNPSGDDLLWTLQEASAKRNMNDYNSSSAEFDRAEDYMKYYDTHFSIANDAAAIAVNDNIMPYKGEAYDGVMTNTYKALNFMSEKRYDLARVEFNRAIDRQRRTKEKFEKEIASQQRDLEKSEYGNLAKSSLSDQKFQNTLNSSYPELSQYQAYRDYVNPFVTYLASIYFNSVGETSYARDLLRETSGIVPENKFVAQEFKDAEQRMAMNGKISNYLWIVFENGLGPIKEEFRIDLPLFIATDRVYYAGIALPKLTMRDLAYPFLQVSADGVTYNTSVVSSMDRVVESEFKKDFNAALIRAVASTTGKIIAQYALTNQRNDGGNIGAALIAAYSFLTNDADVRIWSSLPKEFQVASFPIPNNKTITITPVGGQSFNVSLPQSNNVLVYVKIINRNTSPLCTVIPLQN